VPFEPCERLRSRRANVRPPSCNGAGFDEVLALATRRVALQEPIKRSVLITLQRICRVFIQ